MLTFSAALLLNDELGDEVLSSNDAAGSVRKENCCWMPFERLRLMLRLRPRPPLIGGISMSALTSSLLFALFLDGNVTLVICDAVGDPRADGGRYPDDPGSVVLVDGGASAIGCCGRCSSLLALPASAWLGFDLL